MSELEEGCSGTNTSSMCEYFIFHIDSFSTGNIQTAECAISARTIYKIHKRYNRYYGCYSQHYVRNANKA